MHDQPHPVWSTSKPTRAIHAHFHTTITTVKARYVHKRQHREYLRHIAIGKRQNYSLQHNTGGKFDCSPCMYRALLRSIAIPRHARGIDHVPATCVNLRHTLFVLMLPVSSKLRPPMKFRHQRTLVPIPRVRWPPLPCHAAVRHRYRRRRLTSCFQTYRSLLPHHPGPVREPNENNAQVQ